jgi:hypothetical protein
MARLFRWLGERLSSGVEEEMRRWWEDNARQRHGSHHYPPGAYGLDVEVIRKQFRFYTDRFEVPPDDASL